MVTSLIIGGTRGIGLVVSEHLLNRGDQVYTASRRTLEENNHISCDITKDCSCLKLRVKELDNLIFTHRYRGGDWDKTFEVTVKGVENVIQTLLPNFGKSGGSVVVISSNASSFVVQEQPAEYHSSRSALQGLVRYYAAHYGKKKLRFNTVLPNTLIKPENKEFFSGDNDVKKMIEKITPLGRIGRSSDVANLVEFLCSDQSSFITGNNFFIDGGLSLVGQETIARDIGNI